MPSAGTPLMEVSAPAARTAARPIRLLVVASHVVQYFAPLYRALADAPELDLTVAYCTGLGAEPYLDSQMGQVVAWDVPLLSGYRWVVLPEHRDTRTLGGPWSRRNWSIVPLVRRADAVLLSSLLSVTEQLAFWSAKALGRKVLYRCETNLVGRASRRAQGARDFAMRGLAAGIDAGLCIGTLNRAWLRRLGVPEERLFSSPYAVDNDFFVRRAAELRPRRAEVRRAFGLGPSPAVLFAGKLIRKKRPLDLLQAFARARAGRPCQLLFVGDGAERAAIESAVREAAIPDVHLAGFLNQSRIGEAYAAADLFVMPSGEGETWGLVVNEAMCFGLPVIASELVGSAHDLVEDGVTGFRVASGDIAALAVAMGRLIEDEALRARLGASARERVRQFGVEQAASGIVEACTAVRRP